MKKQIRVIDCKQSDNEYLHKDFHGALCYAIKYLDDNFGHKAVEEYLIQVARTYFAPLSEKLKKEGLSDLESHLKQIFEKEQGDFEICYENDTLVLRVTKCPAIEHLKKRDLFFTDRFCLTTVVVNNTICRDAGYNCSCDYVPGVGRCIQKFWREE
jgi:hypothetical protein